MIEEENFSECLVGETYNDPRELAFLVENLVDPVVN